MPPLLPRGHPLTLVLDSSTPQVQAAIMDPSSCLMCCTFEKPTHEALFRAIHQCLGETGVSVSDISDFVYCKGPGSILGIRLAIMMLKTWVALANEDRDRPRVHAFSSLHLAARQIMDNPSAPGDFLVLAEWKKDHWNTLHVSSHHPDTDIQVMARDQIEASSLPLFLLRQKKQWSALNRPSQSAQTDIRSLANPSVRELLLQPVTDWPIYTPENRTYVTWSGERHR